jgi:hypothetical protein
VAAIAVAVAKAITKAIRLVLRVRIVPSHVVVYFGSTLASPARAGKHQLIPQRETALLPAVNYD